MKRGSSGINCLLGLDKEQGISSHGLVGRVRAALGEKRVGHAGTLDPLATGVMLVAVGQAARLTGLLTLDTKGYLAEICFGASTTTDDAEGEVISRGPVSADLLDEAFARQTLEGILGDSMQVPPRYSAISVGGKRAYARARGGENFELEARPVNILKAELLSIEAADISETVKSAETAETEKIAGVAAELSTWRVRLLVSKGCYIRSIARDLGEQLGCGAHLKSLRRISSGALSIDACMTTPELEALSPDNVSAHALNPLLLLGLRRYELNDEEEHAASVGRSFLYRSDALHDVEALNISSALDASGVQDESGALDGSKELKVGERLSLCKGDKLLGIWSVRDRRLYPEVNIPAGVEGCLR